MLIEWFLSIKSLPNLLFGVLCLPGDQSHPFAQPTINPRACCICWAGLLGRAVFPPWDEGPNFGSYSHSSGQLMVQQQGDIQGISIFNLMIPISLGSCVLVVSRQGILVSVKPLKDMHQIVIYPSSRNQESCDYCSGLVLFLFDCFSFVSSFSHFYNHQLFQSVLWKLGKRQVTKAFSTNKKLEQEGACTQKGPQGPAQFQDE